MLDRIIRKGYVVDGSGRKPWIGDVGIKDGKITKIASHMEEEAYHETDAQGKIVAPGFIDIHSHCDLKVLDKDYGLIKLHQGVTTEIFGNCGFSAAPTSKRTLALMQAYSEPIMGSFRDEWHYKTYGAYIKALQSILHICHIGGYVGNGTLRIAVKGFDRGVITEEEMAKIKSLLREALEAGALGLSMGLMYVPENYYTKEQLVEICEVVKDYNGMVTVHIRGEGKSLLQSIQEAIYLARKTQVSLHISHLKAAGKNNWGNKCHKAIALIEEARKEGLDVTCDVYPYTAGSTTLTSLLPPWAMEGGILKTIERIKDPKTRQQIKKELNEERDDWDNLVYSTGWDNVMIASVKYDKNQSYVGKSIAHIAKVKNMDNIDCALDLMVEEDGKVAIVFFHMAEEDMIKVMQLDYAMVISDSLFSDDGLPHPRLYGSFPRLFSQYVREKKVLSLEEAVKKVTYLPAKRIGLKDRGLLKEGYIADVVVFDLDHIRDKATYTEPRKYPDGIEQVFVKGELILDRGIFLGKANGEVIAKN